MKRRPSRKQYFVAYVAYMMAQAEFHEEPAVKEIMADNTQRHQELRDRYQEFRDWATKAREELEQEISERMEFARKRMFDGLDHSKEQLDADFEKPEIVALKDEKVTPAKAEYLRLKAKMKEGGWTDADIAYSKIPWQIRDYPHEHGI